MSSIRECRPGAAPSIAIGVLLLLFPVVSTTSARADEDAVLCAAAQDKATAMNQVMGGKSLGIPGQVFDSYTVDCAKRILSFVISAAARKTLEPSFSQAVEQREVDNVYCAEIGMRSYIEKGWRIEATTRFRDGGQTTLVVDCTGIPEPTLPLGPPQPAPLEVAPSEQTQAVLPPASAPSVPAVPSTNGAGIPTDTAHTKVDAAGKPVIIDEAVGLNPDCTTTGPITIKIVKQPAHGSVAVIQTSVFPGYPPSNVRNVCNSRQVPGYRVLYTGKKGYAGSDSAELEIFWPAGAALDLTVPILVE